MNVVGIDLGTTNSLVAGIVDGEVAVFTSGRGEAMLPSAVGMDGERIVVGRAARNRRLLDPERTVTSVKRRMGEDVKLRVGERELSPPQISALILGALLDQAEARLGSRPERAVITVPAYFNDAQRQATRDAGMLAGIDVERLVNEPTAAALGYRSRDGIEELVMVYDLGGGTFDVSILERDEDVLEVASSHGDTQLGGDDVDAALYRWVLQQLGSKSGVIERDPRAQTRLLEAVERAKIALSERDEVRLFDPFIAGEGADAISLDLALDRAVLKTLAEPLIERTLSCIDRALADAGKKARDLDRVILVGGSSRMAIVREMVENHLDMPAWLELDADKAVVHGAAMLAGRVMGAEVADVLIDITPHTLSAGVLHGDDMIAAPLIERGTVVPAVRRETYYTVVDDQDVVDVPITQGEARLLELNTSIGAVCVEGLPPSPARSPVEVEFRLDLSGVLHVTATHLPSGRRAETRIAKGSSRLTERTRRAQRAELDALQRAGEAATAQATESDLALAKAMLSRADRAVAQPPAKGEATARVRECRTALLQAVETRSPAVADLTDALSDALLDLL